MAEAEAAATLSSLILPSFEEIDTFVRGEYKTIQQIVKHFHLEGEHYFATNDQYKRVWLHHSTREVYDHLCEYMKREKVKVAVIPMLVYTTDGGLFVPKNKGEVFIPLVLTVEE